MPYSPEHKRETRERILKSARHLFNRKGFAEVTIDEIMAEAGLTRGGFYNHFDTKERLYAEAISQFICDGPEVWQRVCRPIGARASARKDDCRRLSLQGAFRGPGWLLPDGRAAVRCGSRRRGGQGRLP